MKLDNVKIYYGAQQIIDSVSLEIHDDEIFVLMGPSGSGKTTLLRGIAGLIPITAGSIYKSDDKASVGIAFQEPRLFPHLNVKDNLAFGLRANGYSKDDRYAMVEDYLDILQLRGLEERYPHELSGGQKQRVSLGRAILLNPKVLLLDEPFSSLDTPLRIELTEWLYALQREKGFSILWVTHYIDEAFSVADRIGVIINGQMKQVGLPLEVYRKPCSEDVAAFFSLPNRFGREIWRKLFPDLLISERYEMGWIAADALTIVHLDTITEGETVAETISNSENAMSSLKKSDYECMGWIDGRVIRIKHERNGQTVIVESKYGSWDVFIDAWMKVPEIYSEIKVMVPFEKIIWYSK